MNELQKLYDVLVREGKYTKSFEEFQNQWNDEQYQSKVYEVVHRDGLYTKDRESFNQKYVVQAQQQVQQQPAQVDESLKTSITNQPQQQPQRAKMNYQAVPEKPTQSVERQLMSGFENTVPGFEKSMQQKEQVIEAGRAKKKEASALDLSAQQSLVESTAKQQQEASLLASQQYEQDVKKMPFLGEGIFKDVYQQLQKEKNLPDFVKNQLNQITPDLINLGEYGPSENPIASMLIAANPITGIFSGPAASQTIAGLSVEEAVVPKMNYMFGPLGFTFEESGMTGDYMTVVAPNKKQVEISLNNLSQSDNAEQATKLKNFIASNATEIPHIEKIAAKYAGTNIKLNSEKDVESAVSIINNQYNTLNAEASSFAKEYKSFEDEIANFNSTPEELLSTPEYVEKRKNLEAKLLEINTKRQTIINKESNIQAQKANLEKTVGKYSDMKAQQGTWVGATYTWLGEGLSTIGGGLTNLALDFSSIDMTGDASQQRQATIEKSVSEKIATGNPEEDAKNGGYVVDATVRLNNYNKKSKNDNDIIPEPKQGQSYKDWYNSLNADQQNTIRIKVEDDILKRSKEIVLPVVREGIKGSMTDANTTVEWRQLAEKGFWGGAYAGLVKSLPAMAMPGGWAGRTAAFYAQSTDAVNQEMDNNPAFDEVPESEKLLVTIPIGIANAVLEEIGFRNLISNKGFVNNLVVSAIRKAGVNTTETTLAKIIKNDVKSMVARGLLTFGSASLAEGETGTLQQMSEYAVKDIYNASKKKGMFNTPDTLKEYVYDVVRAGAQEAVGGFIMGTPYAAAAAFRKQGFEGLSDEQFETFEAIANDDKIQSSFIASLKIKVAAGELTMESAKEQLNDYRNSVGLYRSIPDPQNLSTQDKKTAMNLINEKRSLVDQIKDKDSALVQKQKKRIEEINKILNEISNKPAPTTTPSQDVNVDNAITEGSKIQVLTPEEEERKNKLQSEVDKDISIMSFEDAQKELETLNKKENAVQEQTTSEVPIQSETAVSEEVERGKPTTEPQVTTEEVKQEEVTPATENQSKIDDIRRRQQENNAQYEEMNSRQKQELDDLNKKEGKNYISSFDILNINEYSADQAPRSQESIDLANRHEKEFEKLLNEKRGIEDDASKLSFGGYDLSLKQQVVKKLKDLLSGVYTSNRNALEEGFLNSQKALSEAEKVGGSKYSAHGMAKVGLAGATEALIDLLTNGINPLRGRGALDTAPLAGGVSAGTTGSGNAYMEGPFTLVANENVQGAITSVDQIGGIVVNDGIATAEVLETLRELFPNIIFESTSNTSKLVEQLNAKAETTSAPAVTPTTETAPATETATTTEVTPVAEVTATEEVTPEAIVSDIDTELKTINESIGRVKQDFNQEEDDITLYELGNKVVEAKRNLSKAEDTDAAVNELKKAEKEKSDFEESLAKRKDFNDVDNLIADEIENSKKDRYEYNDLFEQDPRLASMQSAKDMIEFAKENPNVEINIAKYENDIKLIEEDIAKFPVKTTEVTPTAKAAPAPKKRGRKKAAPAPAPAVEVVAPAPIVEPAPAPKVEPAPTPAPAKTAKEIKAEKELDEEIKSLEREIDFHIGKIEDLENEITTEKENKKEGVAEFKEKIAEIKQKISDRKKSGIPKETIKTLVKELEGELDEAEAALDKFKEDQDDYVQQYKDDIVQEKADMKKAQKRLDKLMAKKEQMTQPEAAPKKPGIISMTEIEKRFPLAAEFIDLLDIKVEQITKATALDVLVSAYSYLARTKEGAEKTLLQITQLEDLVEALDQNIKKVSKEEFKKKIADSGDFTKAQLKIFNTLIDSLQTETMPEYISEQEASKYDAGGNFYINALNKIISKEPEAFIHEIGHFAFYKILSKEDRLKFYQYMIESSYITGKPSLASRMAITSDDLLGVSPSGQETRGRSNAADDFSEYFAEQFRQWYMSERLFPKDIDAIFSKVAQFFNLFIEKLKSGKYVDQNLSEYFNKISVKTKNQQKKNEKIQEVLGIEETMMNELQDLEDFLGLDPEISPMNMRYDTPLQKMALMYNMTESGFFPRNASEPNINKDFFQFGLKAKRASSGSYYLVNINTGKMAKPLQKPKGGIPPQISPMSVKTQVSPMSVNTMSMEDVIDTARENGFSDDTIKALLMKRGYAVSDIDSALTFNVNFASAYTNNNPRTDSPLPEPFRTIDGGVNDGIKLFFDVRNKLIEFAGTTKKTGKKAGKRVRTYAEIRAKAIELLEAHPIFQGQEDTKQKELIAAFDKTLNTKRGKVISAQIAEIRKALKERLVGMKDLKKAQLILRNFIRQSLPAVKVPRVFFSLEGIISPAEGINYFNGLRKQVYDFARTAPDGTMGKKILKTTEEIKDFATNLIEKSDLYKKQTPAVQQQMMNGFVNSQYTKGPNNTLDIYSQKEVNKLIDIVSQTDSKNFLAQAEKVFDIITEQRAKIKNGLLKEMLTLVNKKAATNKTASGKVRSKGLDAQGQAFYKSIKAIIVAAIKNDTDAMIKIADELSDLEAIQEAVDKESAGEDLTTLERALLDKVYAFDTFADILNMELEEVQDLLDGLKGIRSASIIRLNEKRADRAAQKKAMTEEADEQISTDFKALYNPDGSRKDKNQLDTDKTMIWVSFKELKIWRGLKQWLDRYDFIRSPLTDYFRKTLAHLGTISNILDKSGTFFADNVYRPLNRMDEANKTGYLNEMRYLDELANSVKGITKGYKQIRRLIESVGVVKMVINGKIDPRNGDQLARIYALSLNEVQREKLRNMGYTDQKINQIKEILGPEVTDFVDNLVEYFSNEYYESVNDVYSFVNDVNLGYVENYFPTQTISQSEDEKNEAVRRLEDANFSGTFDAESSPALKERTDMSNPIDLAPSFTNVIENHLQSMERYKAYAEGVKRLNDLFKISSVNTLLEQTGLKRIMKNLVNMSVNPNAGVNQEKTDISRVFNKFSGFALAFKLAQIPKQATAILAAYEDYQFLKGRKVPALDTVMFMFDVAKALTLTRSNFNKFYNLSGNFRDRVNKGVEGDVYGLESGSKVFKPLSQKANTLGDVKRFIKSSAAAPTMVGDIISVYGYMANYNRDIANGMSPEDALEKFNNYNSTLQSRRAADKSTLQFSQNELVRGFTMFGSTGILQMNKVAIAYKNIIRAIANKNVPSGKDLRALAINLGVANAAFVAASYVFALMKGDDEDKEKVKKKMFEALIGLNLFYQIPLIGAATEEVVNAIKGEKNMGSDVTNPYSSVFRKIKKYYDDENTIIENFRPAAELALGMQLDPFIGLYQGATEEFDDEVMYDILGISPSYRPQNASSLENMSKTEMKKYNPEEYERLYGPGSKGYDKDKAEKEEKAAEKKARKDAMDDYYNYESKGSNKRGGSRIGNRGSRTSGSRIK